MEVIFKLCAMKPFRDPEKVVRGLPLPTQEAFKHSNAALIDFICKGSCISFGLKKAFHC